jgi:hypothetical protein
MREPIIGATRSSPATPACPWSGIPHQFDAIAFDSDAAREASPTGWNW